MNGAAPYSPASRPRPLDLAQQHEAVHAGHLTSERITMSCGRMPSASLASASLAQEAKLAALSDLAADVLLKQVGNIGLVVDSEDADAHAALPAAMACRRRGSRTVNSVNSPTTLSTVIVPPCCVVTMSQLIERPKPVPSPVGFVVKNGWNSLSRYSGAMPVPLSRTRISTSLPSSRVVTLSLGVNAESFASLRRLLVA